MPEENETTLDSINELKKISYQLDVDLSIDRSLKPDNLLVFKSRKDLVNFIVLIKEQINSKGFLPIKNKSARINSDPCDNMNGLYPASTSAGFATLNFSTSISDGNVDRTSSYLSGWTLGAGFSQANYYQDQNSLNSVDIIVDGTYDYSLFWNGVGVVYQQPVRYKVSYPCGGGGGKPSVVPLPFRELD